MYFALVEKLKVSMRAVWNTSALSGFSHGVDESWNVFRRLKLSTFERVKNQVEYWFIKYGNVAYQAMSLLLKDPVEIQQSNQTKIQSMKLLITHRVNASEKIMSQGSRILAEYFDYA